MRRRTEKCGLLVGAQRGCKPQNWLLPVQQVANGCCTPAVGRNLLSPHIIHGIRCKLNILSYFQLASFPGLSHLQLLIACHMQERRGEAWGILQHDLRHSCHVGPMSSRLFSTAKSCNETNLDSVLATMMGQVPSELHKAFEAYPG